MARSGVLLLTFVMLLAALLLAWLVDDSLAILISSAALMTLCVAFDARLFANRWLLELRKFARGACRFISYCRIGAAAAFAVALGAYWVVCTQGSTWVKLLPWPAILVACVLGAVVCARAVEVRASRGLAMRGLLCLATWGLVAALIFLGSAVRSEQPTFLLPTGSHAETIGSAALLVLIAGAASLLLVICTTLMDKRRQRGADRAEALPTWETTDRQR